MCGINGFNFKDEGLIQRMNQVISHRGPDDAGFFVDDGISLGHQRLSIIDLSERGHQPMKSQNNNLTIIFNGEIYNFREIRKSLENKYRFNSETDTEVVLYAYQEYGSKCLEMLNGIFAFAIWDNQKKELFLARDRVGVKPLYYWQDGRRFVFSSEIKAILESNISREICPRAFNLYFRMLYAPCPYTMFKGVKKLMPGHYAILRGNNLTIKKYWEVEDFEDLKDKGEAVSKIRSLIKDSVRGQLISDRPVGVFLSGGIDSTAVLGLTREINPNVTKTYSVGFDVDAQAERYNADFELARKTAKFYGTDHHELVISGRDVLSNLEKIIWHMDEPVANPTQAPMFFLAKEAKKEITVVLSGDGADELFAGYQRYYYSHLINKFQKSPKLLQKIIEKGLVASKKQKFVSKLQSRIGAERFLTFNGQKDKELVKILREGIFDKNLAFNHFDERYFSKYDKVSEYSNDFEKYYLNTDRQSWLVDEYLLMVDKMTMSGGIEQRVPILDHRLVELAAKIPTKWKLGDLSRGKEIWIDAVKDYLPDFILEAPKRGFISPMSKWLRTDLREFAYDTINQLDDSLFDRENALKILDDHICAQKHIPANYNSSIIWALITWQVWYNKFYDSQKQ